MDAPNEDEPSRSVAVAAAATTTAAGAEQPARGFGQIALAHRAAF